MCHAVAAAAPAVHCNGIQRYRGAAWQEGRLLLLSSRGVINYLALCKYAFIITTRKFLYVLGNMWEIKFQERSSKNHVIHKVNFMVITKVKG